MKDEYSRTVYVLYRTVPLSNTLRVWSLKMAIFASFVHCLPNILYILGHRQLSHDATVDDLGDISRSLDCFTSNFSRTVRDTAKVTIDY